jgi:hypothetical protein
MMKRSHGSDLFSDQRDELLDNPIGGNPWPHRDETDGDLALEIVDFGYNGCFGHLGMSEQLLLHAGSGEPVSGRVDDVIEPGHNIEVAILIEVAGIPGGVVPGCGGQVFLDKGLVVVVEGKHKGRREGQFDADFPELVLRKLLVIVVKDVDNETWGRFGGTARFRFEGV